MNERKKLIVDGETLLNQWTGLEELADTEIYVSASNYLLAKKLLAKSLEFLEQYEEKKEEYIDAHKVIVDVLNNNTITATFIDFLDSPEPYMNTIYVCDEEQNLTIVIFKGVQLKKADGDEIDPTIDETVAFAEYQKQRGSLIPIYTMNDSIIEFISEFNFELDVRDAR